LVNEIDTLDFKINQIRLKSNTGPLTDEEFQTLMDIHEERTIKDQELIKKRRGNSFVKLSGRYDSIDVLERDHHIPMMF
jgi:hypothetical protein